MITHLSTLPTGGQAQAGIFKNDYVEISGRVQKSQKGRRCQGVRR